MTDYFFPQDRTFWCLHGMALLLVALMQGIFIVFSREHPWFDVISSLLWLPLFTLGVLGFRYQYRKRHWNRLGLFRLVLLVVFSGTVIGVFVAVVMLSLTIPFYWGTLFDPDTVRAKGMSVSAGLIQLVFNNSVSTQMFASIWLLAYISLTHGRRVRQEKTRRWDLENHLQQARLNQLTSQLNPHFLFNSLNNIRFLMHQDPQLADQSITTLSELLRYSLESGRREKIPLRQELNVVYQYLDIMRLQLEHRLNVGINLPESLYECLVPPMSLQILVENAIKHGIEPSRDPGRIELSGETEKGKLSLQVTNSFPQVLPGSQSGTGTGLLNIEQRLRLLYGSAASLVTRMENQTFSATLTLPLET